MMSKMGGHGAGAGAEVKLEGFLISFFFNLKKKAFKLKYFCNHSKSIVNQNKMNSESFSDLHSATYSFNWHCCSLEL